MASRLSSDGAREQPEPQGHLQAEALNDTSEVAGLIRASDNAIKTGRELHKIGTMIDPAEDFRWTLLDGSATETQTLYAHFDENSGGEMLFWQVAYTNLGWSHSVHTTARYFKQGACNAFVTAAVPNSSFRLSADKRSVAVQGSSLEASADGKSFKISFDLSGGNIKNGSELSFEIELQLNSPGFTVGDGKNYLRPKQFISHRVLPCVTIVGGHIKASGKSIPITKGSAVFLHAVIAMMPHKAATRWNLASFYGGPAASLYLLQFETPKEKSESAAGGQVVAHGCLVLDGRIEAVTVDCEAVVHATKLDSATGCRPPTDIEYLWSGTTYDGTRAFSAAIRSSGEVLVDKVDVLAELPYLIRKAIQVFLAKPYYYTWSDRATARLNIGGQERAVEGSLIHEYTFMT